MRPGMQISIPRTLPAYFALPPNGSCVSSVCLNDGVQFRVTPHNR
jgi:hypothetical protein